MPLFYAHGCSQQGGTTLENRRVVITGMGVVAPNGIGIENFWNSLVRGESGIRRVTHFDASSYPCQFAAEVPGFDPMDHLDAKSVKRLDRFAQLTFAAASMAFHDAKIPTPNGDPYRMGVCVGTAIGGGESIETQHTIFMEKGLRRVMPFAPRAISTHSASVIISESFVLKGPNTTISSGCNSGLDACYLAYNAIRLGDADVMVVGAGEAPVTPFIMATFCSAGVLARRDGAPESSVRPYDADASGMVLGEGGASVIAEELNHALNRGAKIYGEILGYSSMSEANLSTGGIELESISRAFETTLRRSKLTITDVDYINAHGNGILAYDVAETRAMKKVFGEYAYQIPVSSIKPVTGQALSPTGLYQVIASLMVIKSGVIPPTINHERPAPECDLDYVRTHSINKKVDVVLMNAHAFGGIHTVLSLARFDRQRTTV